MPSRFRNGATAALLLILAAAWFAGLEYRGLFLPDEGRYGSIAREMLDSGDWITPRLNGLKYLEKPPLQYWATAAAYAAFGVDEWTTRLWPALTGFLGIILTALAAMRLAPARPWLPTLLIFSGCWGYFLAAQVTTLDMGLSFFLTLTLLAFVLAWREGFSARAQRNWILAAWAAMALAVLSKGLVGVLLPALAVLAYAAVERDAGILRRLHVVPGLCVLLSIAAPWFVLVQLRNPEFFEFFFVYEHFQRYALGEHHRSGPWWYFLPVMLVALLPWTLQLPSVAWNAWRARGGEKFKTERFLLLWAGAVVVFFSLSQSKLPFYVLPAVPALLLLLAGRCAASTEEATRGAQAALLAMGAALALTGAAMLYDHAITPYGLLAEEYALWLVAAAALAVGSALAAGLLRRRVAPEASLAMVALGSLCAAQVALSGMHSFDEYYSSERLIETLAGDELRFPREPAFYSVATFDQSVPFYLGRSVTVVRYKGELAPGVAFEPGKHVASIDEFVSRWNEHGDAFAIMPPQVYEKLRAQGLPSRVLAQDARRVIIARQ
jgi:4-amino-4-deoxy-L-arabinose transferase-like glycosyltransferase